MTDVVATVVATRKSSPRPVGSKLIVTEDGKLVVGVGSSTDSCQAQPGVPGSLGIDPCPDFPIRAGIWRYDANLPGQVHSSAGRFVTGLRNMVALALNPDGSVQLLHAGGHVHDVADNGVLLAHLRADVTGDHLAGVHADPEPRPEKLAGRLERWATPGRQFSTAPQWRTRCAKPNRLWSTPASFRSIILHWSTLRPSSRSTGQGAKCA